EAERNDGRRRPRSVRELEQEIIKRLNDEIYKHAVSDLPVAISRRGGELTQEMLNGLKEWIGFELRERVMLQTQEGVRVTLAELEMLREHIINETIGNPSEPLKMLRDFIDPIRTLAQRTDFDFDAMAEVVVARDKYVDACNIVQRQIETFRAKLNE